MSSNEDTKLHTLITQVMAFRVVLYLYLYLNTKLSPMLKIALILIADDIKIVYIKARTQVYPGMLANNDYYQDLDKIVDNVGYGIASLIIQQNHLFNANERAVIIGSWAFRMFGVLMYFKTKNRHYLVAFPDVFREFILIMWLFRNKTQIEAQLCLAAVIGKAIVEYQFHYEKTGIMNLWGVYCIYLYIITLFVGNKLLS